MAQLKSDVRSLIPRASSLRTPENRAAARSGQRLLGPLDATHVVVSTPDILHLSATIHTLASEGYVVTAWSSSEDLVPRLRKLDHPVELLVIDGREQGASAWAAVTGARTAFPDLPIVFLLGRDAELRADAAHLGVRCVSGSEIDTWELVALAFALAPVVHDVWGRRGFARVAP
jgi:hypothetical protein